MEEEEIDFDLLELKINKYNLLNIFFWIVNVLLFFGQTFYYFIFDMDLKFDIYFILFAFVNIISLYYNYKRSYHLSFLKYRYKYYKNLKNQ